MESIIGEQGHPSSGQHRHQIQEVGSNPIISELMKAVGGLVAVVDSRQQLVAVNERLEASPGIDSASDLSGLLGLRAGEILGSRHACEDPEACRAGELCGSCAAAEAVKECLASDRPAERICALTIRRDGCARDCYFHIHAAPLQLGAERHVLLFLHDITRQQQLEALERVFFHDVNNTLSSLVTAGDLLMTATAGEFGRLAPAIRRLSQRLSQEVSLQRHLIQKKLGNCQVYKQTVRVKSLIDEVSEMMRYHPAAGGKPLQIDSAVDLLQVETDPSIVLRVLSNMLVNAFEADNESAGVRLSARRDAERLVFEVWNRQFIPRETAQRIFQRNYSTKGEIGRGLGTFSMKLFGEKILGGRVSFYTAADEGTTFRFELPLRMQQVCTGL